MGFTKKKERKALHYSLKLYRLFSSSFFQNKRVFNYSKSNLFPKLFESCIYSWNFFMCYLHCRVFSESLVKPGQITMSSLKMQCNMENACIKDMWKIYVPFIDWHNFTSISILIKLYLATYLVLITFLKSIFIILFTIHFPNLTSQKEAVFLTWFDLFSWYPYCLPNKINNSNLLWSSVYILSTQCAEDCGHHKCNCAHTVKDYTWGHVSILTQT